MPPRLTQRLPNRGSSGADDTNLHNWALITAQRDPWRLYSYPPWLASESIRLYVDSERGVKKAEGEYYCGEGKEWGRFG